MERTGTGNCRCVFHSAPILQLPPSFPKIENKLLVRREAVLAAVTGGDRTAAQSCRQQLSFVAVPRGLLWGWLLLGLLGGSSQIGMQKQP